MPLVTAWYTANKQPHVIRTFHAGRNVAEEIAAINKRIAEAVAFLDYATVAALSAEAEALKNAEDARPHWTREDSGVTKGWHFLTLDHEGRRAYIAEQGTILAAKAEDGSLEVAEVFEDEGSQILTRMW